MTEQKNKGGRPTVFSDEVLQEICERLSTGETLAEICRSEGMPGYGTVMVWQREKPEVDANIARARELGYDVIAARTRQTARGMGDSTQDVQRDKLIIDTDLKLLAKWSKRYCDKLNLGGQEDNPIKGAVDVAVKMTAEEAYRKMLDGDA